MLISITSVVFQFVLQRFMETTQCTLALNATLLAKHALIQAFIHVKAAYPHQFTLTSTVFQHVMLDTTSQVIHASAVYLHANSASINTNVRLASH